MRRMLQPGGSFMNLLPNHVQKKVDFNLLKNFDRTKLCTQFEHDPFLPRSRPGVNIRSDYQDFQT